MTSHRVLSTFLLAALALPLAGGTAPASTFTLTFERAIPAPDPNTVAIEAAADGTLWVYGLTTHFFFQLDPVSGTSLRNFSGNGLTLSGIGVSGGTIFGAQATSPIARFDASSGTQISSVAGPVASGSRGLTFIGGNLYVAGVLLPDSRVRLGRVDPASGALLSWCTPVGLEFSQVIGRIGPFVCFVTNSNAHDDSLRIVDPDTGAFLEDHFLFAGRNASCGAVSSATELFITRPDLDQIWVYSYQSPVTAGRRTWGAIQALYR